MTGPLREQPGQPLAVCNPGGVLGVVGVQLQLQFEGLAQPPENVVVAGGDHHGAIRARKCLVGCDHRDGGSHALRKDACRQVAGKVIGHPREGRVQQGRGDVAAASRPLALHEGPQDRDGRPHPRAEVDDRRADARRVPLRVAGHRHETGTRLHERVVSGVVREGAYQSVRGDRHVDDLGVHRAYVLAADAVPVRNAAPQCLYHHVGTGSQIEGAGAIPPGLEVEDHPALVAVHNLEEVALPPDERRPPSPRRVAPGRLHLDDIGAEVAQDLGRERPGEVLRKVDHAHTRERRDGGVRALVRRRRSRFDWGHDQTVSLAGRWQAKLL